MTDQPTLIWHDPAWQKQAHEWIRTEAKRNSIQITGEIEQNHAYAWSTVMRVPTDQGMLFFKATAGETLFEIALTQKLAGWFPNCLPELVAVDTERGWMLMRDGGETLRTSIRPTQDVRPWEPVITSYADLRGTTVAGQSLTSGADIEVLRLQPRVLRPSGVPRRGSARPHRRSRRRRRRAGGA